MFKENMFMLKNKWSNNWGFDVTLRWKNQAKGWGNLDMLGILRKQILP